MYECNMTFKFKIKCPGFVLRKVSKQAPLHQILDDSPMIRTSQSLLWKNTQVVQYLFMTVFEIRAVRPISAAWWVPRMCFLIYNHADQLHKCLIKWFLPGLRGSGMLLCVTFHNVFAVASLTCHRMHVLTIYIQNYKEVL